MDQFFPGEAWIRISRETLDALHEFRMRRAAPGWDAAIDALLQAVADRGTRMTFAAAERVADAVLYEGYVLYPYRASAAKNRFRWQFGVVVPPGYAAGEASEAAAVRTDCLLRAGPDAALHVRVRFLRLEARRVELPCPGDPARFDVVAAHRLDGRDLVTWDVGLPHTVDLSDVRVADLLKGDRTTRIDLPAQRTEEVIRDGEAIVRARVVRERWPLTMRVRISAAPAGAWIRVTVRVENTSDWPVGRLPDRDEALRQSCASTHVLVAAGGGTFVSLTDPEPDAAAAASECVNQGLWPVLVGPEGRRDLVLASPIILPDYPEVASESPGDLCDATEIDEILTLRIMTMTDDEKREACATDERARRDHRTHRRAAARGVRAASRRHPAARHGIVLQSAGRRTARRRGRAGRRRPDWQGLPRAPAPVPARRHDGHVPGGARRDGRGRVSRRRGPRVRRGDDRRRSGGRYPEAGRSLLLFLPGRDRANRGCAGGAARPSGRRAQRVCAWGCPPPLVAEMTGNQLR
jgi:hypothetical protein